MEEPIENLYFNWLYSKVAFTDAPSTPATNYTRLLSVLHNTEFVWLVVGDDNRAEDGIDLRRQFLLATGETDDPQWHLQPCSFLEMLVALIPRLEFQTETSAREWFWIMLQNIDVAHLNDSEENLEELASVRLETVNWRTYTRQGHGGLFPLSATLYDQRKVEVWHQFCEYLTDNDLC